MALREYVWTGEALRRAWAARGGERAAGVAAANLELVERLAPHLARVWPADGPGQGAVLQLATMWSWAPAVPTPVGR